MPLIELTHPNILHNIQTAVTTHSSMHIQTAVIHSNSSYNTFKHTHPNSCYTTSTAVITHSNIHIQTAIIDIQAYTSKQLLQHIQAYTSKQLLHIQAYTSKQLLYHIQTAVTTYSNIPNQTAVIPHPQLL